LLTNLEIAAVFREIADRLLEKKENWFKVRAYRRVAEEIEKQTAGLAQLATENRLREVPGVGDAIEKKIKELLTTGRLQFLEKLKAEAGEKTGGAKRKS